jgi:hypothetical protein
MYGNIEASRVTAALNWLTCNNPLYTDVVVNKNWQQSWRDMTVDDVTPAQPHYVNQSVGSKDDVQTDVDSDATILYDFDQYAIERQNKLRGIPYDSCMQEEDEQDIRDKSMSIALAENQQPVAILTDR